MSNQWLSSTLALALGALTLAGCGANQFVPQAGVPGGHVAFRMASKAVVDAFPYGLGWDAKANAAAVVNDLADAKFASLGFHVQDAPAPAPAPKSDLRPLLSPVANQGRFGSCTGFAMTKGIAEFMELKQIRARGGDPAKDFVPLSPAFLWYNERAFTKNTKIDTGATMFLGMNELVNQGVCPEADMPYCPDALQKDKNYRRFFLANPPSDQAVADAKQFRGGSLRQITKLSEIKASLDEGYPCVFGFIVFSNIKNAKDTGLLPMPSLQEDEVLGGHATVAVGYDDDRQVLVLKNSWGDKFGDHGYLYMPYKFFNSELNLVHDGWTMREAN